MKTGAAALLVTTMLAGQASAQQSGTVMAVLPFENGGSYGQPEEVFRALELGLAVLLAGALDRHPGVDVVEPASLRRAMEAAGLPPAARVDAGSAGRIAHGLKARHAVTGGFADYYGKVRLHARLVDAATGRIVAVVSNDDPRLQSRADLAAIVNGLAKGVVEAAGLRPGAPAPAAVPTEALIDFSRGLLHETLGESAAARDFYRRAAAVPGFEEAEAGLRRVGGS